MLRLQLKGGRLNGRFEIVPDHMIGPDLSIVNPATDKGEPQETYRYFTALDGKSPPVLMFEEEPG